MEILKLSGKAAKEFLKYDKRKLTKKEKERLRKARQYYLTHIK